ncbi:MAG: hypothetical protein SOT18_03590, partial [Eubacterium sp.]|nr:hypothetical protein [Eubacterium sp.]
GLLNQFLGLLGIGPVSFLGNPSVFPWTMIISDIWKTFGCGCSAITLCGYIMNKLKKRKWKRVLFVPTGALLSPVSFNEGNSIPGIAHGVVLEVEDERK